MVAVAVLAAILVVNVSASGKLNFMVLGDFGGPIILSIVKILLFI